MVVAMFDYMSRPHTAMSDMVTIGHKDTRTGEMTSQVDMPMFGLGVYLMKGPGECKNAVSHAIECGYRLIDTAMAYGNESEVGDAGRQLRDSQGGDFYSHKTKKAPCHRL